MPNTSTHSLNLQVISWNRLGFAETSVWASKLNITFWYLLRKSSVDMRSVGSKWTNLVISHPKTAIQPFTSDSVRACVHVYFVRNLHAIWTCHSDTNILKRWCRSKLVSFFDNSDVICCEVAWACSMHALIHCFALALILGIQNLFLQNCIMIWAPPVEGNFMCMPEKQVCGLELWGIMNWWRLSYATFAL